MSVTDSSMCGVYSFQLVWWTCRIIEELAKVYSSGVPGTENPYSSYTAPPEQPDELFFMDWVPPELANIPADFGVAETGPGQVEFDVEVEGEENLEALLQGNSIWR